MDFCLGGLVFTSILISGWVTGLSLTLSTNWSSAVSLRPHQKGSEALVHQLKICIYILGRPTVLYHLLPHHSWQQPSKAVVASLASLASSGTKSKKELCHFLHTFEGICVSSTVKVSLPRTPQECFVPIHIGVVCGVSGCLKLLVVCAYRPKLF